MTTKGLVAVWLLFVLAIFSIGYITTHLIVTRVMADFQQPGLVWLSGEPLPVNTLVPTNPLEVKEVPKNALQTDQYTPLQGAVTPIGVEL